MKILIKPSEIIERCLWDEYERYCLSKLNKAQINQIILNDEEFEISEKDAFVINLTNVIYTDNVAYKLQQYLKSCVMNKSFEYNKSNYMQKDMILMSIDDFYKKFPKIYLEHYDNEFTDGLKNIKDINKIISKIQNLKETIIQDIPCVVCGPLIKFINEIK